MVRELIPCSDPPREFEWTVDAVIRAARSGLFDGVDAEFELFDGRLIEMPTEQPHSIVSTFFYRALEAVFGMDWVVWKEAPLRLRPKTRPQPDVSVVPGPESRWLQEMPKVSDARLVVEVSTSTLRTDMNRKAEIYGGEGVEEYWVVDVYGDRLYIHTGPREGGYRNVQEVRLEDSVPYIGKPLSELIPVRYERRADEESA